MTANAQQGPTSVIGQLPTLTGGSGNPVGGAVAYQDQNPDIGASFFWMGVGLRDPRYMPRIGSGSNVAGGYPNQDCGWYQNNGVYCINAVPSTLAANNIASVAGVTNGVPLALAGASAGITVLAAPFTALATGLVVPTGSLVLDGTPGWAGAGPSGAFAFFNPAGGLARCISVTGVAGGTGGTFVVRGGDVYGQPMTQNLIATAGATSVLSTKAFKFMTSITPNFTDAHAYTFGTTDIYGLPLFCNSQASIEMNWANSWLNALTTFVAGSTATPSPTTGDVRGTFGLPTAANGANVMVVRIAPNFAGIMGATAAAQINGLVGLTQA
jgi:hypothetical protein